MLVPDMDFMDVTKLLKFHFDSLPNKAQVYAKSLDKSSKSEEKKVKLVIAILHHVVLAFKADQTPAFLDIILLLTKYLISQWEVTKVISASSVQLDLLLYESIKNLKIQENFDYAEKLAECFLQLSILPDGCSKQNSEWFSLKLLKPCSEGVSCMCHDDNNCELLMLLGLQLKGIKIRLISESISPPEAVRKTADIFQNHLSNDGLCQCHGSRASNAVQDFMNEVAASDNIKSSTVAFCNLFKALFAFAGFCSANECSKKLSIDDKLDRILTSLKQMKKTISKEQRNSDKRDVDKLYTKSLTFYLSFTRRCSDRLAEVTDSIVKCVNLFLNLKTVKVDCAILAHVFTTYSQVSKHCNALYKGVIIREYLHLLPDPSTGLLSGVKIDQASLLTMLKCVYTISVEELMDKNTDFIAEIASLTGKVLEIFNASNEAYISSNTDLVLNVGILNSKAERKLGKYQAAMGNLELTIKLVPNETSKLVTPWLKAKQSLIEELPKKARETVRTRTLAKNLTGKIPNERLICILMHELKLYESLANQTTELNTILDVLLSLCDEEHPLLPEISCKKLTHSYYSGQEESVVQRLCENALACNQPWVTHWENFIQIKFIDFLLQWSRAVKTDDACEVDLTPLLDIVQCCRQVADEKHKIRNLRQTSDVIYNVDSVLCLFGESLASLKLMISFHDIVKDLKTNDPETQLLKSFHICSTLCKISNLYISLNQANQAVKYAELAYKTHAKHTSQFCPTSSKEKSLAIEILITKARALSLSNELPKADSLIMECEASEFLQSEKTRSSSSSALMSIQVMEVRSEISSRTTEPRIRKLVEMLRRITAWNGVLNPTIAKLLESGDRNHDISCYRFGTESELVVSVHTQMSIILHFLQCLHALSKTYLLIGEDRVSEGYIHLGLRLSKFLLAKYWCISFGNLKTQLISFQEKEEKFKILTQALCQLVSVQKVSARKHAFSTFFAKTLVDDEELVSKINEHLDTSPDKFGCSEDDAIEVDSRPIDMDAHASKSNEVMASPRTARRKNLKSYPVPDVFIHTLECECSLCSNVNLIATQLDYACIVAEYCARSDDLEQGLRITQECLNICLKASEKIKSECNKELRCDYSVSDLFQLHSIRSLITQANIYNQKCERQLCLECYAEAKTLLQSKNLSCNETVFQLKARLQLLLSSTMPKEEKHQGSDEEFSHLLNVVIDSMSLCNVSPQPTLVSTPVAKKSVRSTRGKTQVSRSRQKSETKPARCRRVLASSVTNNFEILDEGVTSDTKKSSQKNKLPLPDYLPEEQADRNGVYNFLSSDEENVPTGVQLSTMKKTQNVMQARKAATRRHRRKVVTLYTEEDQERVRALCKETGPTRRKKKNAEMKVDSSLGESSNKTSFEDKISLLKQGLENATAAGDFFLTKSCSQALALCYFCRYDGQNKLRDIYNAVAFHFLSIGVTLRTIIYVYAQTNAQQQNSNKTPRCKASKDYQAWLQDAMKYSNPHQLLKNCSDHSEKFVKEIQNCLKDNWTVCAVSVSQVEGKSQLIITRLRKEEAPLHMQIDGKPLEGLLDEFNDLMLRNVKVLKSRDKSYWWSQRKRLDLELNSLASTFSSRGFGFCCGMLLGKIVDKKLSTQIQKDSMNIVETLGYSECMVQEIEMLLNCWHCLSAEQRLNALLHLCGSRLDKNQVSTVSSLFESKNKKYKIQDVERHHVILVLDKDVQCLPLESDPLFQHQSMTRMPSVDVMKMQMKLLQCAEKNVAKEGVDLNNVSYVINPQGDLAATERMYKDWFQNMMSWKGIISRAPTTTEWMSSISDFDLFIFCGHGSGSKYMCSQSFRNVRARAAALLMGCSSGKLEQDGIFEPSGIILHYLISGSPCILGCLWPVTDKDIDKYLGDLLRRWALDNKSNETLPLCARQAKGVCKMPNLNGSCCVIYGLPVHCQSTIEEFFAGFPS